MSGTVSAGTYTAGSMLELHRWLSSFYEAKQKGVKLKAVKETANYTVGDVVEFSAEEIPAHDVQIKSMTGASGGGVSASLFLAGLSTNKLEELLKGVWMNLSVEGMLKTDDLKQGKSIYALLNTKPIDDMKVLLANQGWGAENHTKDVGYLADQIELYLTLASLEGIPYKTLASGGAGGKTYAVHQSHMDYIKFNFHKNGTPLPSVMPFGYDLSFAPQQKLGDVASWAQLIESAPATGAFPFGFKPRTVKRYRKEYEGKLFYLNYDYAGKEKPIDYAQIKPAWPAGNPEDRFDMEYVDGGTFNREPHDLARASLIRSLNLGANIPNDGVNTTASVLLIDPFPAVDDATKLPGEKVVGIPSIFGLLPSLGGALLNHGRFRADWLERSLQADYYSRYLIAPIRTNATGEAEDIALAGKLLGAFSGFLSQAYRQHDYHLGRYNAFRFYEKHFGMKPNNVVVQYYNQANEALQEKMEAVGWYFKNEADMAHCQVIPRTFDADDAVSNVKPVWPSMTREEWEDVRTDAVQRIRAIADVLTPLKPGLDWVTDNTIWSLVLKKKVYGGLESVRKLLVEAKLLRG